MDFTQQQIDALIEGVYNGSITTRDLPVNLYNAISAKLLSALGSVEGSPSKSLLNQLSENIYMFSGAKVYQQIQDISLLGNDENIKSFANFRDEALSIYDQYNKNWLETEYSTAIGQAQSATRWEQIEQQKKELPYLQYSAVIDPNTSDICLPLDGICLPVENPFWDVNTPLNHFNCRCTVIQFDKTDATDAGITSKEEADRATEQVSEKRQPLFEGNSGKDRLIFNGEHPYFDVPKADREFAKENFGLPIPQLESIFTPARSIKEARTMFSEVIAENSSLKIGSITIDSALELEQINVRLEATSTLFKEYNVSPVLSGRQDAKLILKSTKTSYGYIERIRAWEDGEVYISKINLGSLTDSAKARTFNPEFLGSRSKSAVDLVNLEKATTVHEFAHILGTQNDLLSKNVPEYFKEFFKDLAEVRKEYVAEINTCLREKNLIKYNEISLGRYCDKNLNEFMAEGFTEYKLNSNPNKYAQKIGKLIDKAFKK
jgi:SPP1 gp7 family putative phage head morphogenesis protein